MEHMAAAWGSSILRIMGEVLPIIITVTRVTTIPAMMVVGSGVAIVEAGTVGVVAAVAVMVAEAGVVAIDSLPGLAPGRRPG